MQGKIQTTKTNDYGFTSYKINGQWFGADSKGPPRASEGESVSFESFDKAGKDGKVWPTIKLATFKKIVAATTASPAPAPTATVKSSYQQKEDYWAAKATEDAAKDPRIAYFASSERAIQFVDLALRNGAFIKDKDWAKVKQTDKLAVLESFVDYQTARIMAASYAAKVPSADKVAPATETEAELESDLLPEENWS